MEDQKDSGTQQQSSQQQGSQQQSNEQQGPQQGAFSANREKFGKFTDVPTREDKE
jgi:hypothetical protein